MESARAAAVGPASDAALQAALAAQMKQAGTTSGAYVYDVTDGRELFAYRATRKLVPASNEKLLTTSSALEQLGAKARIETSVYGVGSRQDTLWDGDLYLKGQGDPTFGAKGFAQRYLGGGGATTDGLAALVAGTGITEVSGHVYGDESYFDALRGVAGSGFGASSDLPPLSALAFDSGYTDQTLRAYQGAPAKSAASGLAQALRAQDVEVAKHGRSGELPTEGQKLATVSSPTVASIVKLTNKNSNNYFAELLLKQLGARASGRGTTVNGAAAVQKFLGTAGVSATVVDGSGLSRGDRISPRALGTLLTYIARRPGYRSLHDSLPIAGRDGTLRKRMRGTAAQGRVYAKTGTLSGVSSLSGYASTKSGDLLVFSTLMNGVNVTTVHTIQDRMAAAIAGY